MQRRVKSAGWMAGMVAVAVLLAWNTYDNWRDDDKIDALATALTAEQDNTRSRGEEPVAPEPDDIVEEPEIVQGPQGIPGPAPSREVVIEAARHVLSTMDLSQLVDEEQIAVGIAAYIADHRGDFVGPAPSPAELRAAILAVYAENPPPAGPVGPSGPAGPQGPTGPPPDPAAIADAVAAYVAEVGMMLCEQGYHPEVGTFVLADGPPRRVMACFADD